MPYIFESFIVYKAFLCELTHWIGADISHTNGGYGTSFNREVGDKV